MAKINNSGPGGQIQIADDVIAMIAGTAAMEIEGVAGMTGNFSGIAEILGLKNLSKGVKVDVSDENVNLDIHIIVKFGYKIHEVSTNVQQRVKNAVESMTGFNAGEINIFVSSVQIDKEKAKEHPEHYPESE